MMPPFAHATIRRLLLALLAAICCLIGAAAIQAPTTFADRADVQAFIRDVARSDHLPFDQLQQIFTRVIPLPGLLHVMDRPREATTWGQYSSFMLSETRIAGGADFWRAHKNALNRANRNYGVPPAVVVALLGIETVYGRKEGNWRVIDALTTLAFGHPRRGAYFRRELEDFLVMTLRAGIDPLSVRGSSAGAFGMAQFMPSNAIRYGLDFDGDGQISPADSAADAIGSVGNFLAHHGWKAGQPIAIQVATPGPPQSPMIVRLANGTTVTGHRLTLQGNKGPEYWVVLPNFEVLTTYNRSINYAMAVDQLSIDIQRRYAETND